MFDEGPIYAVGHTLAGIGAVNWGLVALADANLVEMLLGTGTLAQAVYVLVALGGLQVLGDVMADYSE